jgi:hypothetical protein
MDLSSTTFAESSRLCADGDACHPQNSLPQAFGVFVRHLLTRDALRSPVERPIFSRITHPIWGRCRPPCNSINTSHMRPSALLATRNTFKASCANRLPHAHPSDQCLFYRFLNVDCQLTVSKWLSKHPRTSSNSPPAAQKPSIHQPCRWV